ncbi:MAG: helix-turn-helix domain-containing protein [Bacteroidia bacterium]
MSSIKVVERVGEALDVDFAFKSMESIAVENGGKPDDPHRHNFFTVIFAIEASGKHTIDFHEYDFSTPCVFFVSPGQVHCVATNGIPHGYVFLFTQDFLLKHDINPSFISDLNLFRNYGESPALKINEQKLRKLETHCTLICEEFEGESGYKFEKIASSLKLFLIECAESCNLPSVGLQHSQGADGLLKRFKALVDSKFREEHSVTFFANELHITTGHLNKTIKSLTGVSAKEFIQKRITTEAKRLAIYSNLSSKEIGFELGFEDPAHFSTFFKKCTGMSFSSYRKSN